MMLMTHYFGRKFGEKIDIIIYNPNHDSSTQKSDLQVETLSMQHVKLNQLCCRW